MNRNHKNYNLKALCKKMKVQKLVNSISRMSAKYNKVNILIIVNRSRSTNKRRMRRRRRG